MAQVAPKGAPDSRPLEVADDSLDYWTSLGYVQVGQKSAPAKKTAKKAAKKSSK